MTDDYLSVSDNTSRSLAKITKGAGLAFTGSLVGTGFGILSRMLIARIGTEAEYGVYSLAFVVFSIAGTIATLGLDTGTPRAMAIARVENNLPRVKQIIDFNLCLGIIAGISLGLVVFLLSDPLANSFFNDDSIEFPLKLLSIAIPLFAVLTALASIFRGFDNVKPKIYFLDIIRGGLFILMLLPILILDTSFTAVYYAFLVSFGGAFLAMVAYSRKSFSISVKLWGTLKFNPETRELLTFSLPLLGSAIVHIAINWVDTMILGWLKTSAEVGLYSAAIPAAQFLKLLLLSLNQIYVPIISGLYGKGDLSQIRILFSLVTKWLSLVTLPLFLILFLFPETVLTSLFGSSYGDASNALRILSIGFMINNLLGPNGSTLAIIGKTPFVMWTSVAILILDIILNIAFIPLWGIEGAALASSIAFTTINLIRGARLYTLSKSLPLSQNLTKTALPTLAFGLASFFLFKLYNINIDWWMLPLLLLVYYFVCGLFLVLTRSLDHEDIDMLITIEGKTRINLSPFKKILRRFL